MLRPVRHDPRLEGYVHGFTSYSRWDSPQHVLTDDPEDADPIWPGEFIRIASFLSMINIPLGKDYSNPRITDFHNLNKPEEDMYDRAKVPRMPWYAHIACLCEDGSVNLLVFRHDVSMQVVGQPARDLARHFVQRWNYLLRIKVSTTAMFNIGWMLKLGVM